jgi:hypothetical protein
VIEDRLNDFAKRDAFGPSRARLGKLHRLSLSDRDEIEGMIAGRIPLPAAVSQAAE